MDGFQRRYAAWLVVVACSAVACAGADAPAKPGPATGPESTIIEPLVAPGAFELAPSEAKLAAWIATIPVDPTYQVPQELRARAAELLRAPRSNPQWISLIATVPDPAAPAKPTDPVLRAARRRRLMNAALRAGGEAVSETESLPFVSFSVHARVLEPLLRTGLISALSENGVNRTLVP